MTTQTEMREMKATGLYTDTEMAAHVTADGGYNGVASGFGANARYNKNAADTGGGVDGTSAIKEGDMDFQRWMAAQKGRYIRSGEKTTFDEWMEETFAPLSEASVKFREGLTDNALLNGLDNTLGVFGGHPGQTYWESIAPPPTSAGYAQWVIDNPRGKMDGFTYQMTETEKNAQLDHAFTGTPTTEGQFRAVYNGTVTADGNLYDSGAGDNNDDGTGSGTSVPRVKSHYTNATHQTGSNTAAYGDNYFKAIPDAVFAAANPVKTAQNSPLAGTITSPSASNSVATSYGNSRDAGRQWTSTAMGGSQAPLDGGGGTGDNVLDNKNSINSLYKSILGRDVGQDGLNTYLPMLNNGTLKVSELATILQNSAEKANSVIDTKGPLDNGDTADFTADGTGADSTVVDNTVVDNTVVEGDSGSNNDFSWTAADGSVFTYDSATGSPVLVSGATNNAATVAPLGNEEYLKQQYKYNFGREIGQEGLDHYLPMLDSGTHVSGQTGIDQNWLTNQLAGSGEAKSYNDRLVYGDNYNADTYSGSVLGDTGYNTALAAARANQATAAATGAV